MPHIEEINEETTHLVLFKRFAKSPLVNKGLKHERGKI